MTSAQAMNARQKSLALLTLVIADRIDLDTEILAQAIVINTVIAFVAIPLVRTLLF